MAKEDYSPLQTVAPSGPSPAYLGQRASAANFGAFSGAGLERLGGAMENAGEAANQNAVRMQIENNEAAVKDAYAQFSDKTRQTLFHPETGFYAQQGSKALAAYPGTIETLKSARQSIGDTLQNPAQRDMFDRATRSRMDSDLDGIARHTSTARMTWRNQSSDALLTTFHQDAGTYFNDPQRFDHVVQSGVAEIRNHAADTGQPPEMTRAREADFVSKSWMARLNNMRIDDPVGAEKYYRANQDLIGPAGYGLGRDIKAQAMKIQASNIADVVVARKSATEPAPGVPSLAALVENQESGGYAPGAVPDSSKGAIGVMQLMPGTAREMATKLGIPYDENRLRTDPEYNRALGRPYLDEQMTRYGGNETVALAAYNAGPGRADQWLKQFGDPTKGEISNEEWASKIPFDETRNYVKGVSAKRGGAPTKIGSDWITAAREEAVRLRPDDPAFADMAAAQVKTIITERRYAADQLSQEQAGARQRWLSDWNIDFSRGKKSYTDIETAYAGGNLTPPERANYTIQLDTQAAAAADRAAMIQRVGVAAAGGAPLDPKDKRDKDALDLHFDQTYEGWKDLPFDEKQNRMVQYSAHFGMAPTSVKNTIRSSLRGGSPDQTIAASNMVAGLRNANPQILNDFADEDIRLANLVQSYSASGMQPAMALQMATDSMKVDKVDAEARTKAYDEAVKAKPNKNWIQSKLSTATLNPLSWFSNPADDPRMDAEFDQVSRMEYQRTGNLDASRQFALDTVNRVWGRTEVAGEKRYMKYAPEKIFGAPSLSQPENARWMSDQLLDDVAKAGGLFQGKLTKDRLIINPDPTRTDAAGNPIYLVSLVGDDKVHRTLTRPDGRPMEWQPNWATSKMKRDADDAYRQNIEDMRAGRAGRPTAGQQRINELGLVQ